MNMLPMFVTLDVSKLSGWLNAPVCWNMYCMSVTLDVSKLSGWLNANAPCRVGRRAYATRGERAWGDGSASGVHEDGLIKAVGVGAHAERTKNM